MADQTLEILIKARNESQAAFAQSQNSLKDLEKRIDSLIDREKALGKEMAEAGDAQKALGAVSQDLGRSMSGLADQLGPVGSALKAIGPAGLIAAAGGAAFAAAWMEVVGTLASMSAAVVKAAGDIQDLSTKAGAGTTAFQEWVFAGKDVKVSAEAIATGVAAMTRKIEEGSKGTREAVKGLGLDFADLFSSSPEDQFRKIADAMRGLSEGEQASFARSLGLSSEMLKLLRSDLEGAAEQAHALGAVMSEDTIKAADGLGDAAGHVQAAWEGVKAEFVNVLVTNKDLVAGIEDLAKLIGNITGFMRENAGVVQFFFDAFGGAQLKGAALLVKELNDGLVSLRSTMNNMAPKKGGNSLEADTKRGAEIDRERNARERLARKEYEEGLKARAAADKKAAAERLRIYNEAMQAEKSLDAHLAAYYKSQESAAAAWVAAEAKAAAEIMRITAAEAAAEIAADRKQRADEERMRRDLYAKEKQEEDARKDARRQAAQDQIALFETIQDAMGALGISADSMAAQLVSGWLDGIKGAEAYAQATTAAAKAAALVGAATDIYSKGSAKSGAAQGAAIGTGIMPGWGTVIGAGVGALVGWLGGKAKAKKELEAFRKEMLDSVGGSMDELRKKADLLGIDISRAFSTKDPKELKRLMDAMNVAAEAQQKRWEGIQTALAGLALRVKGLREQVEKNGEATEFTQAAFNRMGQYAAVTFAGMIRETGDAIAALRAMDEPLADLAGLQEKFGFEASKTLARLLELRDVLQNNQAAADSLQGLNQLMKGLGEAGMVSRDLIVAFGQDAVLIFNDLVAGGADANTALALMQPTLQELWERQRDFGDITDEATLALLEQAEAQGLVGDKMRSVNEQVLQVLLAIADVLGASLPDAFRRAGDAADAYG